jgi:hypothetical protein
MPGGTPGCDALHVGCGTVLVHLTLEPGEVLTGSASSGNGGQELAFSGWLGLLEVLDVLRRRAASETAPAERTEGVPKGLEAGRPGAHATGPDWRKT